MRLNSLHTIKIFSKKNKEVILVDIIPDFVTPQIHSFDANESEILEKITQTTLDFVKTNLDPEKTLVIRLVHSFKLLTNKTS